MTNIEHLSTINNSDLHNIITVWESSARATHTFLTESDLEALKPEVAGGVNFVKHLYCIRNTKEYITAFVGVHNNKIEMLFVDAAERGNGIGRGLVDYALKELNVKTVDVNEQNPQAVGFYQHMGFKIVSRSELDDQGNPFPILHMSL